MDTVSAEYLKSLRADPEHEVAVIITSSTKPATNIPRVEALGLTVTRTFNLVSAMAANGPAHAVMLLAKEPWVASIEADQPVRTLKSV